MSGRIAGVRRSCGECLGILHLRYGIQHHASGPQLGPKCGRRRQLGSLCDAFAGRGQRRRSIRHVHGLRSDPYVRRGVWLPCGRPFRVVVCARQLRHLLHPRRLHAHGRKHIVHRPHQHHRDDGGSGGGVRSRRRRAAKQGAELHRDQHLFLGRRRAHDSRGVGQRQRPGGRHVGLGQRGRRPHRVLSR